jgi:hypothetical protein
MEPGKTNIVCLGRKTVVICIVNILDMLPVCLIHALLFLSIYVIFKVPKVPNEKGLLTVTKFN